MTLYTKKGDAGDTGIFGCDQRISKSSATTEALGALDEVNSFLGICKVKTKEQDAVKILKDIQQTLFIIQAEVAGSEKTITKEKIKEIEDIIDDTEKKLPEIKSFFVSGGTELAVHLDFARTLARRAERRVVAVNEERKVKIGKNTLAYLNRLSSLLYARTRLTNYKFGITEESPHY